jgi:hypothetical protein
MCRGFPHCSSLEPSTDQLLDLLSAHLATVFGGLFGIERTQQRRDRQFAAAVDTDIHVVFGIEFKIEP